MPSPQTEHGGKLPKSPSSTGLEDGADVIGAGVTGGDTTGALVSGATVCAMPGAQTQASIRGGMSGQ